jgi:site-specific DNA-methyltransferase (adenine-specific)
MDPHFCQVEAVGRYQELFGKKYRRGATWVKPDSNPQQTGDRPAQGTESIVCAWGQPERSEWNAGGKRGVYDDTKRGVYEYNIKDRQQRVHATQKPVPLMRALLRDFTEPGETVLDPFMGSGTCGVACLEEGCHFIGIERDPKTFADACQRLASTARQTRLFARPAKQPRLGA